MKYPDTIPETLLVRMSDEGYHGDETAISRSRLADSFDVGKNPDGEPQIIPRLGEYWATHIAKTKDGFKETPATKVGSVAHACTLDRKPFRSLVDIIPSEFDLGDGQIVHPLTAAGAINSAKPKSLGGLSHYQTYEQHQREKQHLQYFLKADDAARCREIIDSIKGHVIAERSEHEFCFYRDWIEHPDAINEHALFWTDPTTGLRLKCKPDMIIPGAEHVFAFDLKITDDPSPRGFRRKVKMFRYWLQDIMYRDGLTRHYDRPVAFRFVTVGAESPHQVAIHSMSEDTIEWSHRVYREALASLASAIQRDCWVDDWQQVENVCELQTWDFSS